MKFTSGVVHVGVMLSQTEVSVMVCTLSCGQVVVFNVTSVIKMYVDDNNTVYSIYCHVIIFVQKQNLELQLVTIYGTCTQLNLNFMVCVCSTYYFSVNRKTNTVDFSRCSPRLRGQKLLYLLINCVLSVEGHLVLQVCFGLNEVLILM